MYEIDVCYKIIFEAMLEKPELKSIAAVSYTHLTLPTT